MPPLNEALLRFQCHPLMKHSRKAASLCPKLRVQQLASACFCLQVEDSVQHAVQIEPSSWERGLDERRLTFRIDTEGNILDVNASAPTSLFGFW